jgi:diketogulonate reductase-like aldo/keto reductase
MGSELTLANLYFFSYIFILSMKSESLPTSQIKDIPVLGLGTYLMDDEKNTNKIIKDAIECGYRHIDTAKVYGNEQYIGTALQEIYKQKQVKREDLFICSKLWDNDKKEGGIEKALRFSLKQLQTNYLDLYLIHFPVSLIDEKHKPMPLHKVWAELEHCVELKLVKHIGVSNFNAQLLIELLTFANIKPYVNQIEIHPYFPQVEMISICKRYDIIVEAYSPLGSPGNSDNHQESILKDPTIIAQSHKYNKTPAQIILNWSICRGCVILPKSTHTERIKENFSSVSFKLNDTDVKLISEITIKEPHKIYRVFDPKEWDGQDFKGTPLFA